MPLLRHTFANGERPSATDLNGYFNGAAFTAYTPAFLGVSIQPTTLVGHWEMIGKLCVGEIHAIFTGSPTFTALSVPLPAISARDCSAIWGVAAIAAANRAAVCGVVAAGATQVSLYTVSSFTILGASGNVPTELWLNFSFETGA